MSDADTGTSYVKNIGYRYSIQSKTSIQKLLPPTIF